MAQGYKLVLRPSEPGVKGSKKLYYAVSKVRDLRISDVYASWLLLEVRYRVRM